MAKKAQKRKNTKTVNMKMDLYLSPMMFTVISGGKQLAKNMRKHPYLVGLSEKGPKTLKEF